MSFSQIKIGGTKIPTKLGSTTKSLSETEIIDGLKEALTLGSANASQSLNKLDGFYKNPKVKIPFPEDCQRVATELRKLGYGKQVDEFEVTLNRAAEDASKEAATIFANSIKQMTVTDAKNILTGPDTAATGYLRKTTSSSLYNAFAPHITTALDKTTATKKWEEITTLYNKLPLVKKVDTDLTRYTTNKALNGLFVLVADEETKIRKDPAARVSDILKKVFGS
ncbi:hypothetical protein CHU_2642 [Sporocytophaga myxococcoides]|uniref:DUF4197 domain-containing protein n=1 Tax=Sporocytophaga myxococcoides TaxID=153721 RepID=A0A098LJA2_9BACT|nr:hypothetical protein CHU_2642 [Sporocytophaga myxococcoides]